ncbi:MAG TPA: protein kinase [Gemmatimonadales bacterium]|nr:protein kinase [Gemmatimonadales bacterium]
MDAALRDRYRIERELGRGGMATVYLAHDLRHDRPVALKVLKPALAASLGTERFLLEIRVTARLQHPHILPLIDSGEAVVSRESPTTFLYYVMPYVEGESLRDRVTRERQLPVEDALRIAGDVAGALAYAHGRGVVHRDVKPENILLSNGQAMVADFGIARAVSLCGGERLTETGLALGTPHYMSPEQVAGDPAVDARSDVYALGCVLYEMLAGEPPFTGPTARAVAARSLVDPAPPVRKVRPTVPDQVESVIGRALAKVPADRFATAAEFGEALSRAAAAPPRPPRSVTGGRWRLPAVLVLGVLAAAAVLLLRGRRAAGIIAPASSIAVLPFTPSGTDTALSRLGRDLVYTLSAELDGLGGIRVVDAHTVLARTRQEELAADTDWPALARSFGAGSVVQGSLVRVGPEVRLDLALLGTDSAGAPLARATVTARPDSVAALTDSAARAMLVQIWSRGTPPTPSLDGALRTRSVPALRAFLQGEGEITHGRWDAAAVSYRRAMDADPAFWLAYARHVYARHWSLLEPADSVVALLERHRSELPERERLSTEAILLEDHDSIGRAVERARVASERYPDSWFGWLIYGDQTLHDGPVLGRPARESRAAFERAVQLNPDLIPVWEHLMLITLLDGDTAGAGRSLRALDRLDAGPSLTADGYGNRMLQFRFLHAIQRGDRTAAGALADSVARDVAPAAVPSGSFYDPICYGWFADQIRVSRQVLAADGPPDRRRVHRLLLALSWGGRGAWDSALVNLDRLAADGTDTVAALRAYGLAAVGVWLDAVDPREAAARRAAAARAARGGATGAAELAWLDGVLAGGRRDRRALAEARAELGRSVDPARRALDRSLGALDAALRGDIREAGKTMATLEWEQAELLAPDFASHPLAVPLDRLAAARWLAASGDAEQAVRLLRWVDGPFLLHPSTVYSFMFAGLADLERGRAEERLGHADLAASYYQRFLQRYDRPVQRHLPLVEEAKARLRERAVR